MAGLEVLQPYIYHERQQPGSMLCAQHALNSLLQSSMFTAPDLAAIAQNLDALEASVDEANNGRQSTNMDDTGFFSVQVLEEALKVWGLRLVRWRSEDMIAFQDKPYTQLGFILNLELHWFTLRRFGPAHSDPHDDPGEGHWFNLNSFLEQPEWISRTYLGMVLQQAEQEGYSVFAVCELDPSGELTLTRTEADELAGTLPQPTSSGTARLNTSRVQQARTSASASTSASMSEPIAGAEDEDLMLQAALQASLMGDANFNFGEGAEAPAWLQNQDFSQFQARPRQESLAAGSFGGGPVPGAVPRIDDNGDDDMDADDPVAASIARSRALLERMRRDQDMAMRGALDDDIMQHVQRAQAASNLPEVSRTGAAGEAPRRRLGDDEEDALLQQALAASQGHIVYESPPRQNRFADLQPENDDVEMDNAPPAAAPRRNVVYDDDDAELQAALRESLAGLPEGFMLPPSPGPVPAPSRVSAPSAASGPVPAAAAPSATEDDDEPDAPAQEPSPEELRRKRLARFS
ncbi:Josephin-domain-containing protein [Exidia glandulosa HHB12029]|uniref:ubiquitinyl hydrolase 1 n=1 Tax=Exidia glandulosa HHB12029 TaxID=1314781 RepID=A0A165N5L5_EXIGL|nr:Josephin-domain-containing protein [Exidia glandulosa HHB12029]